MYVSMYVLLGSQTLPLKGKLPFTDGSVLEGYFIIVAVQSRNNKIRV